MVFSQGVAPTKLQTCGSQEWPGETSFGWEALGICDVRFTADAI